MTAQRDVIGYGIDDYSFLAVVWAAELVLGGFVILLFAPGVRGDKPVRFMTKPRRGGEAKTVSGMVPWRQYAKGAAADHP